MDEKPDQIIGQIEAQREELGRNLNELETRVRRSTDWRTHFDRNPTLMLGAALGGGVLLGSLMAGGRSTRRVKSYSASTSQAASTPAATATTTRRPAGPATSVQKTRISETVDHVKAALIAFGIAKTKEFLSALVPGIEQHLEEAERSRLEHHSNLSSSAHGGQDFRSHTQTPGYRSGYSSASDYRAPETAGGPGR